MLFRFLLTLALAAPIGAHAQRFAGIANDCKELSANTSRDGVTCSIGEHMGQPALLITVVAKEGDPRVDRARKAIRSLQRDFYADGGTQLVTLSTDKAGQTWERYCFRSARFPSGHCNDPVVR